MNVLKEKYQNEVAPVLMKELGMSNRNEVPRITKIAVNIGLGEALDNPKSILTAIFVIREQLPGNNQSLPKLLKVLLLSSFVKVVKLVQK